MNEFHILRVSSPYPVARVKASEKLIETPSDALDLIMNARYATDAQALILDAEVFSPDFFKLSTGLAGEILQKCMNYKMKLAILGDYSGASAGALHDFILESNQGHDFCFLQDEAQALEWLNRALDQA